MFGLTHVFVCVCALLSLFQFSEQLIDWAIDDSGCITPDGGVGDCINLHECEPIIDAIFSNSLNPAAKKLDLNDYLCSIGKFTKVCCPRAKLTNDINTRAPRVKITPKPKTLNSTNTTTKKPEIKSNMTIIGRNLLPQSACGLFESEDRVSNGEKATVFEFPWMALLAYQTQDGIEYSCGGTLINNRYILTAAHCVLERKDRKLSYVRLGELDIKNTTDCDYPFLGDPVCHGATEDVEPEKIITHPGFNFTAYENDIALIRLKRNIKMKGHISPICLPITTELQSAVLKNVVITGWGLTEKETRSDILIKAEVSLMNVNECAKIYKNSINKITINKNHMCAGGLARKGSCSGDSGSPVQVIQITGSNVKYVQYGVYSFGFRICGGEMPGVYTKVANYMDWIIANVRP